jgi:hypothetical protein
MVAKWVVLAALLAAAMVPATAEARAREGAGYSVHVLRHGRLIELYGWPERGARARANDVFRDVRRGVVRIRSDAARLDDLDVWVLRDVRVIRDDPADVRGAAQRLRRRMRELKARIEAQVGR